MSIKQFKFVSPGIFINEIDQSQIPRQPEDIGPVIIGRAQRGPNLVPITCQSYEEFYNIFGEASPGLGNSDAWRNGSDACPTYGSYAAQAYFRNGGPVTFVKLAGLGTTANPAGWSASKTFGLFVGDGTGRKMLAGVFYSTDSGATFAVDDTTNGSFKITINPTTGDDIVHSVTFNKNDENFVRKLFNTDPTLTNSGITPSADAQVYWLGQTFESSVLKHITSAPTATKAAIFELDKYKDWERDHTEPQTGWVISQANKDTNTSFDSSDPAKYSNFEQLRLFKIHSLRGGEWEQKNIKISIQDIKPPANDFTQYGTFSVVVRQANDTDVKPKILERFTNVTLDSTSDNFVAKQIGDRYYEWTEENGEKKYKRLGKFDNVSGYIRIEMKSENNSYYAIKYPFGFEGPTKFKKVDDVNSGTDDIQYPTYLLRESSDIAGENLSDDSKAYFGVTNYSHNGGSFETKHSPEYGDHSYIVNGDTASDTDSPEANAGTSFVFTLDDLIIGDSATTYLKGTFAADVITTNEAADTSFAAEIAAITAYGDLATDGTLVETYDEKETEGRGNVSFALYNAFIYAYENPAAGLDLTDATDQGTHVTNVKAATADAAGNLNDQNNSYSYTNNAEMLLAKHDRFTMPLHGGFDGISVKERDPFRNSITSTGTTSYAFKSIERAINTVADPEVVEMNLMAAPGISAASLTKKMIDVCESRGDALAIIDIENDYKASSESTATESNRLPSPTSAVTSMKARSMNSSYGACFYPWVTIRDEAKNKSVDVPPSVAMMGVMASSAARSELWFAPAGFTRGGLSANGAAGLPVVDVKYQLSSKERDSLYENNINPIASFPNEGIVVFGQKTLQVTQSALDRINVRRLMIYVKKEISRMSSTLLFEPNVNATWSRFLASADPFLRSVQSRFGLTEYKVILDETTTTPELIDRNIMYAKIFLKPARAIEFIALDFTITNTGASFEDL